MKIWVIGRSYPMKENKMQGSFEIEQARLFADRGHQVIYLAVVLHPIHKVYKWGLNSFIDGNINVLTYSIPFTPQRMHVHSRYLLRFLWNRLFAVAENLYGFPDIIHIHYPGLIGSPESTAEYKNKGAKIVTTEHWSKVLTDSMDTFQRKQLIKFANIADEMICVGKPLQQAIINITNTSKEIHVVPNVVSRLFKKSKYSDVGETYNFVAVGRLVPVKQMDLIALAFCEEFRKDDNICLTIVGGGPEYKTIQSIIKKSDMGNNVFLVGTQTREDTANFIKKSHCLICYSSLETFGVPVIEAWASGKPVIVSDCIGSLEYFNKSLGILVSSNNISELREAMRQMTNSRDKYDKNYIAEFAQSQFGEQAVYDLLLQIYRG